MKALSILMVLTFCIQSVSAQISKELDADYGNIICKEFSSFKNLTKIEKSEKFDIYVKRNGVKKFYRCDLDKKPSYSFASNTLSHIIMSFAPEQFGCILHNLQINYGKNYSKTVGNNGRFTKYVWSGYSVRLELICMSGYDECDIGGIIKITGDC